MARITDLPSEIHQKIILECVSATTKQIARNKLYHYTIYNPRALVDKTPLHVARVCSAWAQYVVDELLGQKPVSARRRTTLLAKFADYKKACVGPPTASKRLAFNRKRVDLLKHELAAHIKERKRSLRNQTLEQINEARYRFLKKRLRLHEQIQVAKTELEKL